MLANQNVFWADTKHQPQQLELLTNQSNKLLTIQNDRVISMKLDRLSDHSRFVPQDSSSNQVSENLVPSAAKTGGFFGLRDFTCTIVCKKI